MVSVLQSKTAKKLILSFQQNEINSAAIYSHFASCKKDAKNCKILNQLAQDEAHHATIWKKYTQKDVYPNMFKVWCYRILTYILGYTFVIKLLELNEYEGIKGLEPLKQEIPEVEQIINDEKKHEKQLIEMLDEDRLNYIGAMVLGLNDALVELTGTIAGLTFVLMNTKLIAMAGIITGIAATLSMAASNYLAERAEGNPKALKASFYTGIAYLFTVVFLVLPYLIFPNHLFLYALACMILIVIFLVFVFNFYIATVKTEPFWPKFLEMFTISLSVAFISFLIGYGAKIIFGLEI